MAGQGVGILTPALWAPELRSGRLVQPFDLVAEDGKSDWLVYPETRRNVAKIRAWRDWLLDEVQRSEFGALALRVAAPTLSYCPGGRPVRLEQAQGMLVAALGLLVAHFGLAGRPRSSSVGAQARQWIGA